MVSSDRREGVFLILSPIGGQLTWGGVSSVSTLSEMYRFTIHVGVSFSVKFSTRPYFGLNFTFFVVITVSSMTIFEPSLVFPYLILYKTWNLVSKV